MVYSYNEIPNNNEPNKSLAPCNYMDASHIQNVEWK